MLSISQFFNNKYLLYIKWTSGFKMVLDRYSLCSDRSQLIFIIRRFQNCKFTNELKFICNIKTNTRCTLVSMTRAAAIQAAWCAHPQLKQKAKLCLPASALAGCPLCSLHSAPFLCFFWLLILLFKMTPMCSAKVLSIVPNHTRSYDIVYGENICVW